MYLNHCQDTSLTGKLGNYIMSRSQETFNKKQREKERAKKKKEKREKRDAKRETSGEGLEIDWSSAPENVTLSEKEETQRANTKHNNNTNN